MPGKVQTDQAAKQSVCVRPLSPRARFTRRNCHKNRGSSGESNATGIPSCPPQLCLIFSASFSTCGRESGCSQPSEPLSISGTQRVSLMQLQFVKNLLVTRWTNDCGQTGAGSLRGPAAGGGFHRCGQRGVLWEVDSYPDPAAWTQGTSWALLSNP